MRRPLATLPHHPALGGPIQDANGSGPSTLKRSLPAARESGRRKVSRGEKGPVGRDAEDQEGDDARDAPGGVRGEGELDGRMEDGWLGRSPARRLFSEDTSATMGSPMSDAAPARGLAPSPPLFGRASVGYTYTYASPSSSHVIDHADPATLYTPILSPGLTSPDANGAQRSIHDPGFIVCRDADTGTRASRPITHISTPASRPLTPIEQPVAVAGPSTPRRPRRQSFPSSSFEAGSSYTGYDDKENVAPPRLLATPSSSASSPSGSGLARKYASTPKGAVGDAPEYVECPGSRHSARTSRAAASQTPTTTRVASTPSTCASFASSASAGGSEAEVSEVDEVLGGMPLSSSMSPWTPSRGVGYVRTPGRTPGRNGPSRLGMVVLGPGAESPESPSGVEDEGAGGGDGPGDGDELTPGRNVLRTAEARKKGRRSLMDEVEGH